MSKAMMSEPALQIDGCVVSEDGWKLDRMEGLWKCSWVRQADELVFVARIEHSAPPYVFGAEVEYMRECVRSTPLGGLCNARGEGAPGQRVEFDRVGPFEGTIVAVDETARTYTVTLAVPFDACSANLRRAEFERLAAGSFDANGAPV